MTDVQRRTEGFGWKPSTPDWNDQRFMLDLPTITIPRHVNLSGQCPPIWNQGAQGSCTGHGVGRAYEFDLKKQGIDFMPSRSFIYANSRKIEGTFPQDSGSSVRDSVQGVARFGVPPSSLFPYNPGVCNLTPSPEVYAAAAKHKAISYQALSQDLTSMKACLASGFVFVGGFSVFQNFEDDRTSTTGLVSMPKGRNIGGHCICFCGFNSHNYFMFANSWGTDWGDPDFPGHGWFPPEYITNPNLASDFWVIRAIQS